MKPLLFVITLLLSGCSFVPFFHKSDDVLPKESTDELKRSISVAPEAKKLIAEAQALWDGPWLECKDAQKALDLLDKAISIDPLDANAWLLRSRALGDLGYLDDAFDDATKSIQLSPNAEAYATRGGLLQKRGQHAGAKRDLNYAESLDRAEPLTYVFKTAEDFIEHDTSKGCANLRQACAYGLCAPQEKATGEGLCR